MKTPKEKAIYLVEKFVEPTKIPNIKGVWVKDIEGAKQCALTAVDEILDVIDRDMNYQNTYSFFLGVKDEIKKL